MRLTTLDARKVARIMFHPDILEVMSDDHATDHMKDAGPYFEINTAKTLLGIPSFYFLSPNEHTLFMVTSKTLTLFEVHTMILPEGRGVLAIEATKKAAEWLFNSTSCEKVVTYIPLFNKAARIFAKKAGMLDEGICTKSFKKDGVLHDQWVLGLEKEQICQPLQQSLQ